MNSMNNCKFIGRFVKDPVLDNKAQNPKVMFNLAVDKSLSKEQRAAVKAGDKSIQTASFPNFVAYGETAKMICQWFTKGKPIIIDAEYQTWSKTDPNTNQTTYGSIFFVNNVGFVPADSSGNQNGGQSAGGNQGGGARQSAPAAQNSPTAASGDGFYNIDEDDIPF